jgi:FXSXX-COOH protein
MQNIPLPGDQPQPESSERVLLARLACAVGSPAVLRVVARVQEGRGPGRVSVAAFNSSV